MRDYIFASKVDSTFCRLITRELSIHYRKVMDFICS